MQHVLALLLGFILGVVVCFLLMWKFAIRVAKNKDRRLTLFRNNFYILDRWLTVQRKQFPLGKWLADTKQVHSVAIYGVGVLGKQFAAELADGPVGIMYAIDQSVSCADFPFPIYSLQDSLPEVDLIIVTPADFDKIRQALAQKISSPVVSAEALIKEYYHDGAQS